MITEKYMPTSAEKTLPRPPRNAARTMQKKRSITKMSSAFTAAASQTDYAFYPYCNQRQPPRESPESPKSPRKAVMPPEMPCDGLTRTSVRSYNAVQGHGGLEAMQRGERGVAPVTRVGRAIAGSKRMKD